ncbi:ankyrin domain protein (macronuclear) [Tetrahymena thermophila SB210]|uniref:Ankyrin domain protein n=1 Tax=Tetrahymena thermophila (strain SB210) TaxID=312017 RepID=Q22B84_TETTS|nr:ankyrin domain protein [Tetrahymena thermophila SB210]EAR82569.2 ankyrin domain protein [Tetrahymena thermophila SB210]|eukprot:XP_001030232.2 ankyrin domain protein [Tetrahymena thermophila SB210]
MSSLNSSVKKQIGNSKTSKKLPKINNSLASLKSLSQLWIASQDVSNVIPNNLNESINIQTNKALKQDSGFDNFIFQDNFTKKKITYADLKSEASQRLAQSSNNITKSINSLNEGANLHSFHLNNISQNLSNINESMQQQNASNVSKLNLSAINPKVNSQIIDFQREMKNSIKQFTDYAIILKSSEQQVKTLVKQQLQKYENEVNSRQPNFNSKRLDYIDAQKDILRIEKNSLHSLLNDENFKFNPKLHKMNFVTLCQMSPEDRAKIEEYFKESLRQEPLQQQNNANQDQNTKYQSYTDLVIPHNNDDDNQLEEKQVPSQKEKKKKFNFNEAFDPFKPKKILKNYGKKKKIFDLFQEQNHELTLADKVDLIKENLKENVILKLKQQYSIKNSHLIVPPLEYLSFKDLDVDRNIIILKYLNEEKAKLAKELQENQEIKEKIETQQSEKLPPIKNQQQAYISTDKLPQIQKTDKINKIQSHKLIQSQSHLDEEEETQAIQLQELPEKEILKPFYEMTHNKTDDQIMQEQKKQLEELKQRFKSKQITEEEELFCRRLAENDLIEIEFLLDRNPDLINTIDKEGDTVLHMASRKCNLKVIKYLLSKGANLHALNSNKKTPIEICRLIKRNKLEYVSSFILNSMHQLQFVKSSSKTILKKQNYKINGGALNNYLKKMAVWSCHKSSEKIITQQINKININKQIIQGSNSFINQYLLNKQINQLIDHFPLSIKKK